MMAKTVLDRAAGFLKGLSVDDRVALFHDADPDGLTSALILAKCVEHASAPVVLRMHADRAKYGLTDEMVAKLKVGKVNKLITADVGVDQNADLVRSLAKDIDILIVDHHNLYDDLNGDNIVLLKPQLFSDVPPERYCTAKLAFDAAMLVFDASELDWLAGVGCVADVATSPWMGWLEKTLKKYGGEMKDDLFQTKFGRVASILSSAMVIDRNLIGKCFDVLRECDSPGDVLKSDLSRYKTMIDAELDVWLSKFPDGAEHHGDLYVFEVTPKYRIHSIMSTILGLKYPHRTIVVLNTDDGRTSASARRGDKKVAVNLLLERATEGFEDANAGGHVPAAGASFREGNLSEFKRRLIALAGGGA